MSLYSWNLGMDDAFNGNPPRNSRENDEDYQAGYRYGTPEPKRPEPEYPEPPTPDFEPPQEDGK